MNRIKSWLFPTKTKDKYLNQTDIEKLGFKETLTKGHITNFKRGNMSLKWDFHVTKKIVTIKWGKAMRFFGVVETPEELKKIIKNIDKYFGKK
jgi:hypothetical protein